MQNNPQRRRGGLIVRELDNEILIYDTANDKAHCLNQTAALVWKECNGERTVVEIGESLTRQLGSKVDQRLVWFALKQLGRDQLLEEKLTVPLAFMGAGLNRRELVRALGLTAMAAVPLVTSIVAPTAVQAATCIASGQPCSLPANCCSGICNSGTCA